MNDEIQQRVKELQTRYRALVKAKTERRSPEIQKQAKALQKAFQKFVPASRLGSSQNDERNRKTAAPIGTTGSNNRNHPRRNQESENLGHPQSLRVNPKGFIQTRNRSTTKSGRIQRLGYPSENSSGRRGLHLRSSGRFSGITGPSRDRYGLDARGGYGRGRGDARLENIRRSGRQNRRVDWQEAKMAMVKPAAPVYTTKIPKVGTAKTYAYDPNEHSRPMGKFALREDDPIGIASESALRGLAHPRQEWTKDERSDIVSGCDFITSISVATTNLTGDTLFELEINPRMFASTRLSVLSSLFQQVQFDEVSFHFEPTVPTTTAGAIAMFIAWDPDLVFQEEGIGALRAAASNPTFVQANVWSGMGTSMAPLAKDGQTYYLSPSVSDPRLVDAGTLYVMCASNFTTANTVGNIYMSYKLRLMYPELSLEPAFGYACVMDTTGLGTTPTTTKWLGTNTYPNGIVPVVGSNLAFQYDGNGTFTFTPGMYLFNYHAASSVSIVNTTATLGSSVTYYAEWAALTSTTATGFNYTSILVVEKGTAVQRSFKPAASAGTWNVNETNFCLTYLPDLYQASYDLDDLEDQIEDVATELEEVEDFVKFPNEVQTPMIPLKPSRVQALQRGHQYPTMSRLALKGAPKASPRSGKD